MFSFQINVDRNTNLSFLGLPSGMLHNHLDLVGKLREYLDPLPNDLVNLIQLALLWKADMTLPMFVQHCITQSSRLSERYLYHLQNKFKEVLEEADCCDQVNVSTTLIQQLFSVAEVAAATN